MLLRHALLSEPRTLNCSALKWLSEDGHRNLRKNSQKCEKCDRQNFSFDRRMRGKTTCFFIFFRVGVLLGFLNHQSLA